MQVRTLFAVAAVLQPAVIFIDEIDSILSARKSDGLRPGLSRYACNPYCQARAKMLGSPAAPCYHSAMLPPCERIT